MQRRLQGENSAHRAADPPGDADRLPKLFQKRVADRIERLQIGNPLTVPDDGFRFQTGAEEHRQQQGRRGGKPPLPQSVDVFHVFLHNRRQIAVCGKPTAKRGKKRRQQSGFLQAIENSAGGAEQKKLQHLLVQSCRRRADNGGGKPKENLPCLRFYIKIVGGGKPDGADHPHGILGKTDLGIADRADDSLMKIRHPVGVIDHRKIGDVVGEGVDGEVAAEGILLRGSENVVAQHHAGFILEMKRRPLVAGLFFPIFLLGRDGGAEGRYLQNLLLEVQMHQPETAADDAGVAKKPLDLAGGGIGYDIEILRGSSQKQVAHAPPHQVGDKTALMQAIQGMQRVGADLSA